MHKLCVNTQDQQKSTSQMSRVYQGMDTWSMVAYKDKESVFLKSTAI